MFCKIKEDAKAVFSELIEKANLKSGSIVVIGCSTSEITGDTIGTHSSMDIANALYDGFFDMLSLGDDIKHDPSRVASNIITGIGFLGAGMILVNKRSITGLTTAAGIWTTAGIGMAMGAGMYVVGAAATVIILFAQFVLHSGQRIFKEPQIRKISVYGVSEEGYQEKAKDILLGLGVTPLDISVSKKGGIYDYSFISEMPLVFSEEEIVSSFAYDAKISAGGE